MRNLIGSMLVAVSLVTVPALATAQRAGAQHGGMGGAKHEFGVDVGLVYSKPSGGSGTFAVSTPLDLRLGFVSHSQLMFEPYSKPSGGSGTFAVSTPLDLRLGFVSHSQLMFEPRVSLLFAHTSGASAHAFDLDLNALYGKDHKKGMYLTAGAGADIVGATGAVSGTVFSVNGGVGTRLPYESGAWRLEAFVRYAFKNTSLFEPNTFSVGARAGLSLWH